MSSSLSRVAPGEIMSLGPCPRSIFACDYCGKMADTVKKCKNCRSAMYCGRTCREADIKSHLEVCEKRRSEHYGERVAIVKDCFNQVEKFNDAITAVVLDTQQTLSSSKQSKKTLKDLSTRADELRGLVAQLDVCLSGFAHGLESAQRLSISQIYK